MPVGSNSNSPKFQLPKTPPTLETKDLILRPIGVSDCLSYFKLCSDPDVMTGWGTVAHKTSEETLQLIHYLEKQLDQGHMLRWGITLKGNPSEIIGDVGYWRFVPVRFRGELGAKLASRFWKRAIMSQALERAIQSGFEDLGLNSVEGNIEPDNVASLKLVEKLGFVREGHVKQHTFSTIKNRFVDTYLYSIVKANWVPVINV